MKWYSGTSGFSYTEWKGAFYPEDIGAEGMLAYYAERLPAVEINNTFYQMPKSHVLTMWAQSVPVAFRFIIKASKRITHEQRLVDASDALSYLAHKLEVLEDRLGGVLFQLPPYVRKDMDRLNGFLSVLPEGLPSAMEFRHETWFDDQVFDALAARNVALCVADDGESALPKRLGTTTWLYLRLRQASYDDRALRGWLDQAAETGARTGYAFFKHEDDAAGPALASHFLELAQAPTRDAKPPKRVNSAHAPKPRTARSESQRQPSTRKSKA
jgi:uncharacterized protein YecE (DUF72 family)